MNKKSKPLKSLLKIDQERQSKILIGEEIEKIDAEGQESEKKAAKWVIEENKEIEKEDKKNEADELTKLHDKQKIPFGYTDEIVAATRRRMNEFDKPKGFLWEVYKTKNGRGIEIRFLRPDRKLFARGMDVSFSPNHDINWIIRTLHKALDEMEAFDRQLHPEEYADLQEKIIV